MVARRRADVRARHRAGELQPDALGRRRHRTHLPAAMVLVAHQRVERDRRDGELVRRWPSGSSLPGRTGATIATTTSLLITIAVTTVVWVAATYLTAPTDRGDARRVLPPRATARCAAGNRFGAEAGVGSVARQHRTVACSAGSLGCLVVYAALFGAGASCMGGRAQGIVWTVVFVVAGAGVIRLVARLWRRAGGKSLGMVSHRSRSG